MMKPETEIRTAKLTPAAERIVEGRAIVYDSPTVLFEKNGVKYYEIIAKGALNGADLTNVVFRYNHVNSVMIMAQTKNRTLQLIPDDRGLYVRARLANTTAGRDLYELIRRGDIDKMSFAFTVARDTFDPATNTRVILRFARIWDVSAVDTPAYQDTHIAARDFLAALESARSALRWRAGARPGGVGGNRGAAGGLERLPQDSKRKLAVAMTYL